MFLLAALFFAGCGEQYSFDHSPYPLSTKEGWPDVNIPENNPLTNASVALGKKLFYDTRLSKDGSISCASCHLAEHGFSDPRLKSEGIEGRLGFRNSGTLTNVAFLPYFNRDGGVKKLDLFATVPIEDEDEMGHNLVLLKEDLLTDHYYTAAAKAIYNRSPDAFVVSRALGSFLRTFISNNSKYDQFLESKDSTLFSVEEQRGMQLFYSDKAQCASCHSGILFTDIEFHNNGLYANYVGKDRGRERITLDSIDQGKFRTATLRNVELTAPYMHDGSLATLEDVLNHYSNNGKKHFAQDDRIGKIHLDDKEKTAIIAFLKTLTDQSFITNTKFTPLPSL